MPTPDRSHPPQQAEHAREADVPTQGRRNPGPSWGYQFLRIADKVFPEFLYKGARAIGTAIAMAGMPEERRHSRDYLALVLGRRPSLLDVFRHFFAFEESLMLKLRVANGRMILCQYGQGKEAFRQWMEEGGPVLLGSMHVGVSDMQGCQIASNHQRRVYIVRRRVGNSHDTEQMTARFGEYLKFIWVNDPKEMLFALKEAASSQDAIAMQCDRLDQAARSEVFEFLGARRRFPFTIYHLSFLFSRPVLLSVGVPSGTGGTILHSSPRFEPREGEPRAQAIARAKAHFQEFLHLVEGVLRENPFLWFNFIPLNPVVAEDPVSAAPPVVASSRVRAEECV